MAQEIALQPVWRDVLGDCRWNAAGTGNLQRVFVDVAGENLQLRRARRVRCMLAHQDGDGIGFLPGGAAWHADAHCVLWSFAVEQVRDHLSFQHLECLLVAEEIGDPDQQVIEQQPHFPVVLPQPVNESPHIVDLQHMHTPLYTMRDGAVLVVAEIMSGVDAQQRRDLMQMVGRIRMGGLPPFLAAHAGLCVASRQISFGGRPLPLRRSSGLGAVPGAQTLVEAGMPPTQLTPSVRHAHLPRFDEIVSQAAVAGADP
jgi:hypothetical protein